MQTRAMAPEKGHGLPTQKPWLLACLAAAVLALCASCSRREPNLKNEEAPRLVQAELRVTGFDPGQPLPRQTCKPFPKPQEPPSRLSDTGCFASADPRLPLPSLIPYDVNSPLWSDGADKQRFMALPDGAKLTVQARCQARAGCVGGEEPWVDGNFNVPVGTVLVKSFLLDARFVETRLLIRYTRDNWVGYSYAWNDEQTDALVFDDAVTGVARELKRPSGSQSWYFPSRSECFQCHTDTSGVSLGLESAQLDRKLKYSDKATENQLSLLARLSLLKDERPQGTPEASLSAYPKPADESQPLELRARSYLHANCGMCHQPLGKFSTLDLRYATALGETGLCGVAPRAPGGALGIDGALLLKPGEPALSILSVRMHQPPGKKRMPLLASSVVDPEGTSLVDAWITALRACPPGGS